MADDKVLVENINTPGRSTRVDAAKYHAMKAAMLAVMPKGSPGMKVDEIKKRALPKLPHHLYPGGATAGWWVKCVQLDLEAKGVIRRETTPPVRLYVL